MSDKYAGQCDYVVVGYLADLFEPWADIVGDEWGEFMGALHHLITRCISVSDEARAGVLCGWFRDEMDRAFAEDWWGQSSDYEGAIWGAQDEYEATTTAWRKRAVEFKGSDVLEATIAALPAWVRPGPHREAKPDPERQEYDRLKEKFKDAP
jgi:hypothetical protein